MAFVILLDGSILDISAFMTLSNASTFSQQFRKHTDRYMFHAVISLDSN